MNYGEDPNYFVKKLFLSLSFCTAPLVFICLYYLLFPHSSLFDDVLEVSYGLPLITSYANEKLSVALAMYCKTVPFLAMYVVLKNRREIHLKLEGKTAEKIFLTCVGGFVFYILIFYIFIFLNLELTTTSRKLLHHLSQTDIGIMFAYTSSYASAFMIATASLSVLIRAYPCYKLINKSE